MSLDHYSGQLLVITPEHTSLIFFVNSSNSPNAPNSPNSQNASIKLEYEGNSLDLCYSIPFPL